MSRDLIWTDQALKDAQRLSPDVRERVVTVCERLVASEQGDVRRLRGHEREWRLRVLPRARAY